MNCKEKKLEEEKLILNRAIYKPNTNNTQLERPICMGKIAYAENCQCVWCIIYRDGQAILKGRNL